MRNKNGRDMERNKTRGGKKKPDGPVSTEGPEAFPKQVYPVVVGIGASAGSLDDLKQLFTAMPTDSGFCFFVAMHLSPDRPSMLPEILARYTAMKVVAAEEGMTLLPNSVFLIPANKELTFTNGRFQLLGPSQPERVGHLIDRFFHQLSMELKEKVVVVILSGAGNDGAQGVAVVKRGGGIIIVQEPETAMYPDMPRSAIATGAVDIDPSGIGDAAKNHRNQPPIFSHLATGGRCS